MCLLPSPEGLTLDRSELLDVHFLVCPAGPPALLWELDQTRQISGAETGQRTAMPEKLHRPPR